MGKNLARPLRVGGIAAVVGVVMVAGGLAQSAMAAPLPDGIGAPLAACAPAGGFPWIDGTTPPQAQVHDTNVNTFVGGNLYTGGSAEAEGRVVVAGDMTVESKSFVVGIAIGSDARPNPGELMLQVGGDLAIAAPYSLHIADLAIEGGRVQVGGAASGTISQGTAKTTTGMGRDAALDPYQSMATHLHDWSDALALLEDNGAVDPNSNWTPTVFTGTGADEVQVFTIAASDLNAAKHITFANIRPHTPVLVNVTGGPVAFNPGHWDYNSRIGFDMRAAGDGDIAASIMWNFADAEDVKLLGSSQVPGSVLAPHALVTQITASTNGRIYVGGDLTLDGVGNELHSYPWAGTCADDGTSGEPGDGEGDGEGEGGDTGTGGDGEGEGGDTGTGGEGEGSEPEGGSDIDTGAEIQPEPEIEVEVEPGTDTETETGTETETETGAGADTETGTHPSGEVNGSTTGAAPTTTADATENQLARTGGSVSPALISGGLAVLFAGIATMLFARVRRSA